MNASGKTPEDVVLGEYIFSDPGILGGDPIFRGTRVPVASLFEHLAGNCLLDEFLDNFPSVSRKAAVAVLAGAQKLALEKFRG